MSVERNFFAGMFAISALLLMVGMLLSGSYWTIILFLMLGVVCICISKKVFNKEGYRIVGMAWGSIIIMLGIAMLAELAITNIKDALLF